MPQSKRVLSRKVLDLLKKKSPINPTKSNVPLYMVHELKMVDVLNVKDVIAEVLEDLAQEGTVKLTYKGSIIACAELVVQPAVVSPTKATTPRASATHVARRSPSVRTPQQSQTPVKTTPKEQPMTLAPAIATPPSPTPISVPTAVATPAATPASAPTASPLSIVEQLTTKAEELKRQLDEKTSEVTTLTGEKTALQGQLAAKAEENAQLARAVAETSTKLEESNELNRGLKAELEAAQAASGSLDVLADRVANLLGS